VPKEECEELCEANESVDHPDISLPHSWQLNRARVPVPPPSEPGSKLDAEIRRRVWKLPEPTCYEHMYQSPQF
jgi:hypothetical protein